MEIKINKDISKYKEKFFGLTGKQVAFAVGAIACSGITYLLTKDKVPDKIQTWLLIIAASPMAAIGFFTYNGMTCLQFLKTVFKHYFSPCVLMYKSKSIFEYYISWYRKLKPKEKLNEQQNPKQH